MAAPDELAIEPTRPWPERITIYGRQSDDFRTETTEWIACTLDRRPQWRRTVILRPKLEWITISGTISDDE